MIMNKLVFSSTRFNNLGFQIGFDSKVENAKGVRIEGNSFAPHAPVDREFTIKAGKDSPDNVIKTNARAKK